MIGPILFSLMDMIMNLKRSIGIPDRQVPNSLNETTMVKTNKIMLESEMNKFAFSALKYIERKNPGSEGEIQLFLQRLFSVCLRCTSKNGFLYLREELREVVEDLLIRGLSV